MNWSVPENEHDRKKEAKTYVKYVRSVNYVEIFYNVIQVLISLLPGEHLRSTYTTILKYNAEEAGHSVLDNYSNILHC